MGNQKEKNMENEMETREFASLKLYSSSWCTWVDNGDSNGKEKEQ